MHQASLKRSVSTNIWCEHSNFLFKGLHWIANWQINIVFIQRNHVKFIILLQGLTKIEHMVELCTFNDHPIVFLYCILHYMKMFNSHSSLYYQRFLLSSCLFFIYFHFIIILFFFLANQCERNISKT